MSMWHTITSALAGDVSIPGGLTSPLLSWLGSAGLLLFFGWHASRLWLGAVRAGAPFLAVRPLLRSLAARVEGSDLRHAYERAIVGSRPASGAEPSASGAGDLDRLTRLDQAMRRVGAFRRGWMQFQKTLLIERVPWFRDPRIFSTRRAEEFFTQEAVVGSQIDLAFYDQVPSLITGFGLLLTFVAICIGLSRLHAEGQDITGIQGLINGLAGKFLTSIVGLVCANLFVLLERPAVRRLLAVHTEFVALLDDSFPRRTVEDLLDALGQQRTGREMATADGRPDDVDRATRGGWQQLGTPIEELTSAVRALSARVQAPDESVRMLTAAVQDLDSSQSRAHARIATLVDQLAALATPVAPSGRPAVRERELRAVIAPSQRGRRLG